MSTQFLTETEVSERTRISLATLRRWRLEQRGPKYSKFGSLVRYAEDELTEWEKNQPCGGGAKPSRIAPKPIRPNILQRKSAS